MKDTQFIRYFQSEHAKSNDSPARKLIESAHTFFSNFIQDPTSAKHILYAAILLGGQTLSKFVGVLDDFKVEHKKKVQSEILTLLKGSPLKFNEVYSKWLSENLHRLTPTSVKLLD